MGLGPSLHHVCMLVHRFPFAKCPFPCEKIDIRPKTTRPMPFLKRPIALERKKS